MTDKLVSYLNDALAQANKLLAENPVYTGPNVVLLPSSIKSQAVIPEEALNNIRSDLWWPALLTALHVIPGGNIKIVRGFE